MRVPGFGATVTLRRDPTAGTDEDGDEPRSPAGDGPLALVAVPILLTPRLGAA